MFKALMIKISLDTLEKLSFIVVTGLFLFCMLMLISKMAFGSNVSVITMIITKHNGTKTWTEQDQVNSAKYVNNRIILDVTTNRIFNYGFDK